jgi:GNAT superfamily N-acetyltransferase
MPPPAVPLHARTAPGGVSIDLLADHVAFAPTIARWHFDEWPPADPNRTVDDVTRRLTTWANVTSMPLTYVATEGGEPLGSASLVVHDMTPSPPACESLTPWLSGVYVVPQRRGTGLGPPLVGACEAMATRLGYPEIYLFTGERTARHFYMPMGWRILDAVPYEERPVTVMAKALPH